MSMGIEQETRELFMSLPSWNARDALRMLLEINPDSINPEDDFDGSEIEREARALIHWLYRYGVLPRAIREPYDAEPELISDYLDAIADTHRPPVEWIAAAAENSGAPAEWLKSLQAKKGGRPKEIGKKAEMIRRIVSHLTTGRAIEHNLLCGTAADLLDACKRVEREMTGKATNFGTTEDTFKTWVIEAGYKFPVGRAPREEERVWTDACVRTIGNFPQDVFT